MQHIICRRRRQELHGVYAASLDLHLCDGVQPLLVHAVTATTRPGQSGFPPLLAEHLLWGGG